MQIELTKTYLNVRGTLINEEMTDSMRNDVSIELKDSTETN